MSDPQKPLGEVVSIFEPLLRRVRKDLATGPMDVSYLCCKYGIEFFLQLLKMTEDFVITGEGADSSKFVELRKTEIDNK